MVRRDGKTFFTESDDDNLIKYIAKVKPTQSGRQGNNIYISLEESGDHKLWAKRHSWQSWRERYKKNQDWFNYKIKKYQKKLKEKPSEKKNEDRGELYAELFGISQISEDEGDESDVHRESLDPPFDDVVGIGEAPVLSPVLGSAFKPASKPASKPVSKLASKPVSKLATSSEQKSSATAAVTAPKPPQISEDGGDESGVQKRLLTPSSFDVVKVETVSPAQEPTSKPVISSGQKPSDAAGEIALKPSQHIRAKSKKIAPRDDSNFFGTPSLSPLPSLPVVNSTTPRGEPPILTQGFFRNSFKRPRAAFENVTNDESWPPKRRKKMAKDSDVIADVDMSDAFGRVESNKTVSASLPAEGSTDGPTRLCPPTQLNAVASSSKVLLSDSPHRPAKPTSLLKVIYAKGNPSSDTSHAHTDAPSSPKKATQDTNLAFVKRNHDGGVAGSNSRKPMPVKPMQRLISSPDDDVDLQLARLSPVDVDNPFIANKNNTTTSPVRDFILHPRRIDLRKSLGNATRRRRSRGTPTTTSSISRLSPVDVENPFITNKNNTTVSPVRNFILRPPRIDLRKSLGNTTRRRRSRGMSTTTSSIPHPSNPSFLLPEDREIFDQVGLQKVMAVIAKNYGFDVDVATKAFFATKSIEKTKSLLQFAKEVTNSATSALLSELVNDGDIDSSDDEEAPKYMRRRNVDNSQPPIVAHKEDIVVQQHHDQPPDDNILLPADDHVDDHHQHHRIFIKRISEGQSSLNEDEDDPEVLKLAQEHRDLVMNVMEDDADALRSFEQKHNQDLLRLWSLDWARQKIANM